MSSTSEAYLAIIEQCRSLFEKKTRDYGTSWRILRLPSITDQIYIKASRIRSIQEKGFQKIEEDIVSEFVGIINYSVIALIQLSLNDQTQLDIPLIEVMKLYDQQTNKTLSLMESKNHDYGEAWRLMRVSSITDIILMKLLRTKQIEENEGKTLVSEGVEANYWDMLNYSVFALILLQEEKKGK